MSAVKCIFSCSACYRIAESWTFDCICNLVSFNIDSVTGGTVITCSAYIVAVWILSDYCCILWSRCVNEFNFIAGFCWSDCGFSRYNIICIAAINFCIACINWTVSIQKSYRFIFCIFNGNGSFFLAVKTERENKIIIFWSVTCNFSAQNLNSVSALIICNCICTVAFSKNKSIDDIKSCRIGRSIRTYWNLSAASSD